MMRRSILIAASVLLGGCPSRWDKTADYTSRAVATVGDYIHPVEVKTLRDDERFALYELRQRQDSPPKLEKWQMDHKARALCPKGYVREHAYAYREGGRFGLDEISCSAQDCRYDLVWIVRCDDVPQEPFSIFGKY